MTNHTEATLIKAIKNVYFPFIAKDFVDSYDYDNPRDLDAWPPPHTVRNDPVADYARHISFLSYEYTPTRKYIKIISNHHRIKTTDTTKDNFVHSFVVVEPTKGFVIGDILKATNTRQPALNIKRGNVFDADFSRIDYYDVT